MLNWLGEFTLVPNYELFIVYLLALFGGITAIVGWLLLKLSLYPQSIRGYLKYFLTTAKNSLQK